MPQQSYVIITDTDSELPLSIAERYAVPYVPMPYILKDEDYFYIRPFKMLLA